MALTFDDINWEDGSDNTAGIQQTIYFVPRSAVQIIPKTNVTDPTHSGTFADLATITGNLILKPGYTMKKMYVTLEDGEIKSTPQGEFDGKSIKNELNFFAPGDEAELLGFIAWAKNNSLIWLVPTQQGKVRMHGTEAYPSKFMNADGGTGSKTADRKGFKLTFQSVGPVASPIFTGTVIVGGSGSSSTETLEYYSG